MKSTKKAQTFREYLSPFQSPVVKFNEHKNVLFIGLKVTGADYLAVKGGEDPEDFHITLAYGKFVPRSDEEDTTCRVQNAIEAVRDLIPDKIRFDAIDRFEASESSDGKDVMIARVASGQLERAHKTLIDALKKEGIKLETTFPDYKPHMTLAYIDPGEDYNFSRINATGNISKILIGHGVDSDDSKENTFSIKKSDEDKRLVFGWANVAVRANGEQIEDLQGDMTDPEDLEEGVYQYVLKFRDAGEEHIPGLRKKGRMVESVVFTEEKLQAMGIPAGTVPLGWWVGFYVDDDETWEKIKNGTYKMFSIEGKGTRIPVKKAADHKSIAKSFFDMIRKFNPYHGPDGRFTTSGGAASFTYKPGASRAHDLAIAREKQRTAEAAAASDSGKQKIAEAESKMKAMLKEGSEVNLSGMDPQCAADTADSLKMVLDKYPTLKDAFGGFTTNEPEAGYFKDNQGTYACYSRATGKIHLNNEYFSNKSTIEQKYKKNVEAKFHPEGTDYRSVVVHEMGHAIDRYVSLKTIDNFKVNWGGETVSARIWNSDIRAGKKNGTPMTGKSIRENLSGYASKNPQEYFAEAFSESMTSASPRKTAQRIMKRMETYINKASK